jgi:hypothetical protein
MALSVPKRYHRGFRELGALTNDQFNALLQRLKTITPTMYPNEGPILDETVAGVDSSTVRRIVEAAVSLELGALDLIERSPDEAGKLVADQVLAEDGSPLGDEERTVLRSRVSEVVTITPLRVSTRALGLAIANDRNLLSSRIVTDIRPVFDSSTATSVTNVLVLHRLQLHCMHGEEHEDLIVTLDPADIQALIEQLARAQAKELSLRSALSSFTVLDSARSKGTSV